MTSTLLPQLFASSLIVGTSIILHLVGLLLLLRMLQLHAGRVRTPHAVLNQALVIIAVGFGLFLLHALEIWLYAAFYIWVGEIRGLEDALYFSTSTYATIGYGDVLLSPRWRIFGAIEGADGVILLGWSTAFFFSIIQRLRALEHDWLTAAVRPRKRRRGLGAPPRSPE